MRTRSKVILALGILGGILGAALFVVGFILGFSGALDGPINREIENSVRLENNTAQFDRWVTLPFPLQFKIYAFNVVNPDEILKGAVPIVEEVGPFVYNQRRQKEDIEYDEETDSYKYTQRQLFEFDEELSAFSDDTIITVLNMPLQLSILALAITILSISGFVLAAPILASYPHMLWADDTYANTVAGQQPDPEKHQTFVVIEPNTGTPLQGAKRIQFNIVTRPIEGLTITENLRHSVFPVIWVEEGFNLPDEQVQQLQNDFFAIINTLNAVSYTLIGVGAFLMAICIGYLIFYFFEVSNTLGIFLTINDSVAVSVNVFWQEMFGGDGYFLNLPAKSLFFEGYQFCETTTGQLDGPTIICTMMEDAVADSKTITYDGERYHFSFFGHKNNSDDGFYNVSGGNHDINTLGEIISWESTQYLNAWNGENSVCNHIRGRDSSIYPPFNNESSNFDIFNTDICRIVNLKTDGTTTYEDIEGIVSKLDIDEMANDGDKACYCITETLDINAEAKCLPKGFADMQSCLAAPILASFPHMLWADDTYASTVIGLQPDPDKHQTFVVLEPNTGTPLQGAKRMQFNAICRPITNLNVTQDLRPSVFPVIWVEEGFNLPDEQVQQLKDDYLRSLRILDGVSYALIGVGAALMVICVLYFIFRKSTSRLEVGSEQYNRWREPEPNSFKVYFFNITNPQEITNGEHPSVQQAGPYVYRQYRNRSNVNYNEDSLSYTRFNNFEFDSVASGTFTPDDNIIVLNVPLQATLQMFEMQENIVAFNNNWRAAFNIENDNLIPLFHTTTVRKYLFDGYEFCTNPNIQEFCNNVMEYFQHSKMFRSTENGIVFSFFDYRNGVDGNFEILAGMNQISNLGRIRRWNDETTMGVWIPESNCDELRGTDSSIFPPFNQNNSTFDVFYSDICRDPIIFRIFNIVYDGEISYEEVDAVRYTIEISALSSFASDRWCHCVNKTKNLNGERTCLPNGFEDMFNCLGINS
ncbi:scavenger receptor class b type-1 sr-b1 [Holotrichia oblita]|uniref:Scavenger receptor class b type-1 sr-b1 n=1 Tax=Holotrichia oblita TaxID=644536 RepID=A0ACB9TVK6_HOLOL|nr:scavenger receptor class b type-1 sr-b1 [Holotrichia oblita]